MLRESVGCVEGECVEGCGVVESVLRESVEGVLRKVCLEEGVWYLSDNILCTHAIIISVMRKYAIFSFNMATVSMFHKFVFKLSTANSFPLKCAH